MHEYLWHKGYCELHKYLPQSENEENLDFESKIRNLKDEDLPEEVRDFPDFEVEYAERGYHCVLSKKGYSLEDDGGMYLFRKLDYTQEENVKN